MPFSFTEDKGPACPNGWGPPKRKPCPSGYPYGHFCIRAEGHTNRCRCECGSTAKGPKQ